MGYVYFISEPNLERIKIGFSADPKSRLQQLQTGTPYELTLMGVVDGSLSLERHLHDTLADYRVKGEWFTAAPEVRFFINCLLAQQKWSVASVSVAKKIKTPKTIITTPPELPTSPSPTKRNALIGTSRLEREIYSESPWSERTNISFSAQGLPMRDTWMSREKNRVLQYLDDRAKHLEQLSGRLPKGNIYNERYDAGCFTSSSEDEFVKHVRDSHENLDYFCKNPNTGIRHQLPHFGLYNLKIIMEALGIDEFRRATKNWIDHGTPLEPFGDPIKWVNFKAVYPC